MVTHGAVWAGGFAERFWLVLKGCAKAGVTSFKLGRSIALSCRHQAHCTPATFQLQLHLHLHLNLQRKGQLWINPSLLACASTAGRILTFEMREFKLMEKGGRGLLLIDLAPQGHAGRRCRLHPQHLHHGHRPGCQAAPGSAGNLQPEQCARLACQKRQGG